jgi:hypothetical protein
MWVNNPSTLQHLHRYHGQNVLALFPVSSVPVDQIAIYFISGNVVGLLTDPKNLSVGWRNNPA